MSQYIRLDENSWKLSVIPSFLFFSDFQLQFTVYAYFTYAATSSIEIDDVTRSWCVGLYNI